MLPKSIKRLVESIKRTVLLNLHIVDEWNACQNVLYFTILLRKKNANDVRNPEKSVYRQDVF